MGVLMIDIKNVWDKRKNKENKHTEIFLLVREMRNIQEKKKKKKNSKREMGEMKKSKGGG